MTENIVAQKQMQNNCLKKRSRMRAMYILAGRDCLFGSYGPKRMNQQEGSRKNEHGLQCVCTPTHKHTHMGESTR